LVAANARSRVGHSDLYLFPMSVSDFIAPFQSVAGIIDLFTLILMEIVLGIDNIIFIAIICGQIPNKKDAARARFFGLILALVVRIILLSTISFIAHMVTPLFHIGEFGITGRGLILFSGGVFLLVKTTNEIYHKFKEADHEEKPNSRQLTWVQAILQITLIDIVFSFDSIITAVGLSNNVPIMVMAVVVAMVVMLLFAPYVSEFIEKYPTLKMLALAFLVVIGLILFLEALEDAHILHLPHGVDIKTYAYIALAFSLSVEMLNIRMHNVKQRRDSRKAE
jgi:predicted tellurium resistance membrane protein TerC